MDDPQEHEDAVVIAVRWRAWAESARVSADRLAAEGSTFDASLKRARGEVRKEAAALLRDSSDRAEAAQLMIRNAVRYSVRSAPLVGYDQAAVDYTKARTWQACARELDDSLDEVQGRWS